MVDIRPDEAVLISDHRSKTVAVFIGMKRILPREESGPRVTRWIPIRAMALRFQVVQELRGWTGARHQQMISGASAGNIK